MKGGDLVFYGDRNELKIEESFAQLYNVIKQDCIVKAAAFPDMHLGYSLPIGSVVASDGIIFPSYVGYDIGCGMCAIKTTFKKSEIIQNKLKIFDEIYKFVPTGLSKHKRPVLNSEWNYNILSSTDTLTDIFDEYALKQLGTLGSGNHFIELGYDEFENVWIILHSGSRKTGHSIATHYMKLACGGPKAKEGNYGFRVDSLDGKDYITDLEFCLEYALANRKEMIMNTILAIQKFCEGKGLKDSLINRNHNHVEYKDGLWIHRKGATHAEKDMMGVIPGNMKHGSFIVKGKGNPDSLCSSSHGAGRKFSRTVAKRDLTIPDFENDMKGIAAKVGKSTLDECPEAYKDIFKVMDLQKDLVTTIHHVKPIVNIKGDTPSRGKRRRKGR